MVTRPLLAALLFTIPAGIASADVPPPDDFVEGCTLEAETRPGRACRECSTYYGNPRDHCQRQSGPDYSFACRAGGASTWTEIWCRTTGSAPAPVPAPAPAPTPSVPAAEPAGDTPAADSPTAERPARIREGCEAVTPASTGVAMLGLGLALLAERLFARRRSAASVGHRDRPR